MIGSKAIGWRWLTGPQVGRAVGEADDGALEQLSHWLEVEYMTERIHSALDYCTLAEFETAFSVLHSDPPLAWA